MKSIRFLKKLFILIYVFFSISNATAESTNVTLGSLAVDRGIHFGTFLFGTDGASPEFKSALGEFDMYTLPVFLRLVEPQENQFDFTMVDNVIDAAPPGTVFQVPGMIWNEFLP